MSKQFVITYQTAYKILKVNKHKNYNQQTKRSFTKKRSKPEGVLNTDFFD